MTIEEFQQQCDVVASEWQLTPKELGIVLGTLLRHFCKCKTEAYQAWAEGNAETGRMAASKAIRSIMLYAALLATAIGVPLDDIAAGAATTLHQYLADNQASREVSER